MPLAPACCGMRLQAFRSHAGLDRCSCIVYQKVAGGTVPFDAKALRHPPSSTPTGCVQQRYVLPELAYGAASTEEGTRRSASFDGMNWVPGPPIYGDADHAMRAAGLALQFRRRIRSASSRLLCPVRRPIFCVCATQLPERLEGAQVVTPEAGKAEFAELVSRTLANSRKSLGPRWTASGRPNVALVVPPFARIWKALGASIDVGGSDITSVHQCIPMFDTSSFQGHRAPKNWPWLCITRWWSSGQGKARGDVQLRKASPSAASDLNRIQHNSVASPPALPFDTRTTSVVRRIWDVSLLGSRSQRDEKDDARPSCSVSTSLGTIRGWPSVSPATACLGSRIQLEVLDG
ncbi:hypothetical protein C8Q78DRAFT_193919 [Trametes maxima]|nr:hypothetical protein C8Q78DRAFT_193919 [Trametes maxima]